MPRLEDIHRAARRGDLSKLEQCLRAGTAIDLPDGVEGHTPLMHACLSAEAGLDAVQWLIDHGADVNALTTPPPDPMEQLGEDLQKEMQESMAETLQEMGESMDIDSDMMDLLKDPSASRFRPTPEPVLSVVAQEASIEKLKLLLRAGADACFRSANGYTALIKAACSCREDAMTLLLEAGAPTDVVSDYGESALSRVSGSSRFDLVKRLLDHGADPAPLDWTPLMRATVFGSLDEMKAHVDAGADLEAVDRGKRSALVLAISKGDFEKAEWLISQGAELNHRSNTGRSILHLVVEVDQEKALQWLLDRGFDPNECDDYAGTPLMTAADYGATRCFRLLTEAGADWKAKDHVDESVIQKATHPEIVRILIDGGEDPAQLETEVLRNFIGLGTSEELDVTPREFRKGRKRRFGKKNPEPMDIPFWDAMVRCGWNAYQANDQFGLSSFDSGEATWCHDRFGMSLTCLPDGRFVQIAGEHEDGYDPDFCIYNDVIVHDGQGGFQIHAYPENVFPPTDFHTATLVGSWIYLVGNLSYPEHRKSTAQVKRLHIDSWKIESVKTQGDDPGWIHNHQAQVIDGRIRIRGGKVRCEESGEFVANPRVHELDPGDGSWRRI